MAKKPWVQRHLKDNFVKKSQQDGFFSRAAYKLIEINDKVKLFKPNMLVLDLGAAPGSWSQVAAKYIKPKGKIIALDLLDLKDISKIENIKFFQADINEDSTFELVQEELNLLNESRKFNVIMSDMAPSLSGISSVDGARMTELLMSALEMVKSFIAKDGAFLVKLFQGSAFNKQLELLRGNFKSVNIIKPKASRDESKEVYILAKSLK